MNCFILDTPVSRSRRSKPYSPSEIQSLILGLDEELLGSDYEVDDDDSDDDPTWQMDKQKIIRSSGLSQQLKEILSIDESDEESDGRYCC